MKRIRDTARDWDFETSPLPVIPAPSDPIWQTPRLQRLLAILRGPVVQPTAERDEDAA